MIIERSREKPLKPKWSSYGENYVLFKKIQESPFGTLSTPGKIPSS